MYQQRMNARSVGTPLQAERIDEVREESMAYAAGAGHRQRLKTRFLADEPDSRSAGALLELLLSYAIPQRDVRPLAERLLAHFASLDAVLTAEPTALCAVAGVAEHTAVLIKLCDCLRLRDMESVAASRQFAPQSDSFAAEPAIAASSSAQIALFEAVESVPLAAPTLLAAPLTPVTNLPVPHVTGNGMRRPVVIGRGSDLVTKSVLHEAIELLPRLPDTESLDDISLFLRNNLHFSGLQTRQRYAAYINRRMFSAGYADKALRTFAVAYANQQALRDVAFYRFCCVEPLVGRVIHELLAPALGAGVIERRALRDYLLEHYPESRSIKDASQAIVETLVAGGVARADRNRLFFGYRDVGLPAFAFIIHSEFPEPTMYPLRDLERHPILRTLFWKPDQVLPSLYELRNQGLIARISEIDNVRQFTLRYTLDRLVDELVAVEARR